MRYRRANTPGATYFFTLNAADRSGKLLTELVGWGEPANPNV